MSPLDPFLAHSRIAYLTMEIALDPLIRTYAGGLGVLAGDTNRSCADLRLPIVFVTLASRQGYLRQELGPDGIQIDHPDPWDLEGRTIPLDVRRELRFVFVMNEDRVVLTPTYQTHFATCPVSDQFRRKELKLDKN